MIVVAWSGGPDSTLALKQALDGNEPVAAVHVLAATDDRYMLAGLNATRILEPELSKIRTFPVIRYALNCEGGGAETTDEVTALILCAALSFEDPVIHWGRCKDDQEPNSWINQNKSLEKRQTKMLRGLVKDKAVNKNLPKSDIRKQLGDLWSLTWSCLYPTEKLEPCGSCQKCEERRNAGL